MHKWLRLVSSVSACAALGLCGCGRQPPAVSPAQVAPPVEPIARAQSPAEKEKPARPSTVSVEQPPKTEAPPSPLSRDRAATLVANRLAPSDPEAAGGVAKPRPLRLPAAPSLETPQLPLPAYAHQPAPPDPKPGSHVRGPGPLPEEPPLGNYRDEPSPPRRPELPSAGLLRLPSPDVDQPVPLPVLARPATNRAPLTDPTPEVSRAAVLAAPVPVRTTPAPFVRLNLPDPFEHAQAARLRTQPEEDPHPPLAIAPPRLK